MKVKEHTFTQQSCVFSIEELAYYRITQKQNSVLISSWVWRLQKFPIYCYDNSCIYHQDIKNILIYKMRAVWPAIK